MKDALRRWLKWLQSALVLPVARALNLISASVALVVAAIGIVLVAYFQFQSLRTSYPTEPIPPPYASKDARLDMGLIDEYLLPPTGLAFVQEQSTIVGYLRASDIVGHVEANSPNPLAEFPDDITIIGGSDAALFERVGNSSTRRSALLATEGLAQEINADIGRYVSGRTRNFEIRVVAYDKYGNRSVPTDISFTIAYGRQVSVPAPALSTDSALRQLAMEISRLISQEGTPQRFETFNRAMRVPADCGEDGNAKFVVSYRAAFDRFRSKLTAQNVEGFYAGVCKAWSAALEAERREALKAEEARASVVARNSESRLEMEARTLLARASRNSTLLFVGWALAFFVFVALLLAFLSIERNSRAIRQAMERESERS